MSKLLQIEQKLLGLNQSTFQKLCAAYLKYLYPKDKIKEIGGSHGQDTTTTGTPDIRIDLQNGNYIFVECTRQQKDRLNKFKGDIKNCFNKEKSGIEIDKIEKIILCHNTKSLKETDKTILKDLCSEKNCYIEFIDIDDLKFDLFQQYRLLAKDFLNIEADTLQVLKIKDFVQESEKRATSLRNEFFGRENELKDLIDILQSSEIIIVSGKPGVGKTRIVLQAFKELKESDADYEVLGIYNKGISLSYDLQLNFLPDKKYLLLVDDANRLNEFSHIVKLVDNHKVKIVVTVRDYALDKITKHLFIENYPYKSINIEKLSDEFVKQILSSLKITNHRCVDSITKIADGNPRLVLMSADFALRENDCDKLNNVTDIYDNYFAKSIDELADLKDKLILKVLGIISFFRVVRKDNKVQTEAILTFFDVDENDFWEKATVLHKLELVDLYEDKTIVKAADQVLSLYFFYYTFIKKEICDYSVVLDFFLEEYSGKVRENLYPLLDHFGYEEIIKVIEPKIDNSLANNSNNEAFLLKFYEVFWFCKKTELLVWLKSKIGSTLPLSIDQYSFEEKKDHDYSFERNHPYFKLLKLFSQHPDENFKFSFELILNYVLNKPETAPELIKYIKSDLSFNQESYNYNYYIQKELLNYLFNNLSTVTNVAFFTKLIISISKHFLKLLFEDIRSGRDRNSISIAKVNLIDCETIRNIRKRLWEFLFDNYSSYKSEVFSVVKNYVSNSYSSMFGIEERRNPNPNTKAIKQFDEPFVINFFENKFDEDDFKNVKLYFSYLRQLGEDGVDISKYKEITDKFTTQDYQTYQILEWNYFRRKKDYNITNREDFKDIKKNEIIDYVKDYILDDYIELLGALLRITNSVDENEHIQLGDWDLSSTEIILTDLVDKNLELCLNLLEHIIKMFNPLKLNPVTAFEKLVLNTSLSNRLYSIIIDNDFELKTLWRLNILYQMPKERISSEMTSELLSAYNAIDTNYYLRFDHLTKYKSYSENIWVDVLSLLLERCKEEKLTFNTWFEDFFGKYFNEFRHDLNLLKEIYFYAFKYKNHFDYEGKAFKTLLNADNNFVIDYLNVIIADNSRYSARDEHKKFDFIWEFDNYDVLIDSILDFISQQETYYLADDFCNVFFPTNLHNNKINLYIKNYIQRFYAEEMKMKLIFNVILHSFPTKRVEYISELIPFNNELTFIKKLPLIPSMRVATNSTFAPYYEEDKKVWKELETIFANDFKYIELKQWAKQEQKNCDLRIHDELKREFANEY